MAHDPRFCLVAAAVLSSVFGAGCGHAATEAECEEIFRRSAEIALRAEGVVDAAEIDTHVAKAHEAKGTDLRRECVGKRITTEAMACVRAATTTAMLDECLE